MDLQELRARLQAWLGPRPGVFALQDERGGVRLTEIATAKSLVLRADAVVDVESRRNWSTGAEYLALQLVERPPLALADVGFVFELDSRNTGPLANAPATMSCRDYQRLLGHLLHLVDAQAQPERRREALDIAMVLIASLDGARAVGLPIEAEEAALEPLIRRLEAGA
jgi:hypothetical protein